MGLLPKVSPGDPVYAQDWEDCEDLEKAVNEGFITEEQMFEIVTQRSVLSALQSSDSGSSDHSPGDRSTRRRRRQQENRGGAAKRKPRSSSGDPAFDNYGTSGAPMPKRAGNCGLREPCATVPNPSGSSSSAGPNNQQPLRDNALDAFTGTVEQRIQWVKSTVNKCQETVTPVAKKLLDRLDGILDDAQKIEQNVEIKAHLEAVVTAAGGQNSDIIRFHSQAWQAMKVLPPPELCHTFQVRELLTTPKDALEGCHQFAGFRFWRTVNCHASQSLSSLTLR